VISNEELASYFKNIASKKMLVLFNTCFSGFMAGSLNAPLDMSDRARVAALDTALSAPSRDAIAKVRDAGDGRVIISACRAGQKSWYSSESHNTIFIQSLLEGLKGAAEIPNRGGYVGVFELYDYVWEQVTEKVRAIVKGEEQEPVLTSREVVGPFPVALYRGAASQVALGLGAKQSNPEEVIPLLNKEPTVGGTAVEIVRQQITNTASQGGVVNTGTMGNANTGAGLQINNQGALHAGGHIIQGGTLNAQQYGGVQFQGAATVSGNVAGGDITIGKGNGGLDEAAMKQVAELLQQLKNQVDAAPALSPDARFEVIGKIRAAEAQLDKPDAPQTLSESITAIANTIANTTRTVIGGVQAAGPIYNVLEQLARLVGVPLP
jgi:hypothetical protein